MARDVVPLTAADGTLTIDPTTAKVDADGVVVPMDTTNFLHLI